MGLCQAKYLSLVCLKFSENSDGRKKKNTRQKNYFDISNQISLQRGPNIFHSVWKHLTYSRRGSRLSIGVKSLPNTTKFIDKENSVNWFQLEGFSTPNALKDVSKKYLD